MWGRSRYRRERILLPGEHEGRRSFLKWGLAGGALLALGGGTWLATRRTRPSPAIAGPLSALTLQEATVLLALSERLVPPRPGFPAPLDVDLPRRADAVVASLGEEARAELKQLIRLFENALAGLLLDGQLRTFTDAGPEQQDARIRSWQTSRFRVRRTGYKALKRVVYAAYYGAPATWSALGYPGPPPIGPLVPIRGTVTEGARPEPPRPARPRPPPEPRP
jgi:hypothetical protein